MNVQTKPVQSIGVAKPLLDGPEKVSGKSLYSADFIPEGCLVGRIFRSPVSHAEIIEVDISKAAALPGVVPRFTAVRTEEDGQTVLAGVTNAAMVAAFVTLPLALWILG